MSDLLSKVDPVVAIFAAANVAQWLAYRKDGRDATAAITALTAAVTKLTDRLGGNKP